jgi:hypothetical protein
LNVHGDDAHNKSGFSVIDALNRQTVSCATGPLKMPDPGPMIDYIPHWIGGEPEGIPPRPGTPEYEAWQAKRAKDAATIKSSGQTGNGSGLATGKAL